MNCDAEIQRFLTFMQEHGSKELRYTGILVTKGCDGEFGSCCSRQYDLSALEETLQSRTGVRYDG